MTTKANKWVTERHRLQIYLPVGVQEALDKYIADKFSPGARVVTALVTRAVTEFLEKEGYLDRQGGGKV